MAKDLRSYLAEISESPRDYIEVKNQLRPQECETTALLKHLDEARQYPATMFTSVTDANGDQSRFPLLSNIFATRQRCARALGLDPGTPCRLVAAEYARRANELVEPAEVEQAQAPVFSTVWRDEEVDVGKLPIVKHFGMDLGPVLTMTHVMRSHDGFYDISFVKTFFKWNAREMVVSIHTPHLSQILREYTERGEPAPIVNILGHHPAFFLGALARSPFGVNDYETLGAFLGEPLRLTPSQTWGSDFMLPADAEIVLEGEIPPGKLDIADPFGEVAGLYQAQCMRPVMNVRAMSFRDGAIMQDIFSGFRDSYTGFQCLVREALLEEKVRPQFPEIHEICVPESGYGIQAAYVSVTRTRPGLALEIGSAIVDAMGLHSVVVVDADIDVYDEDQVLWAVHTFFDPANRLHHFVSTKGIGIFDPSVPKSGFATTNWGNHKVVVDATRPTDFAFGARNEIPAEVLDRIRLSDHVPDLAGS
jgi:2,5-furandicarboxylate decarboxylase 1